MEVHDQNIYKHLPMKSYFVTENPVQRLERSFGTQMNTHKDILLFNYKNYSIIFCLKIRVLEHQLDGERRRNKLDFSNMDDKIRSEYAKR